MMRAFGIALLLLAAGTTTATAEHRETSRYAVLRAKMISGDVEGYPDNGEVYIGAHLVAGFRATRVLYGKFAFKQFKLDSNVRDGRPLNDVFLVIEIGPDDSLKLEAYSQAKIGFCIDTDWATHIPEDEIARLRRRYPCTDPHWW